MTGRYPIPSDALDDRLGFVGTAGSGKTYNAGAGVELVLHHKGRVIIPDPLGVWWGLALDHDGKRPSKWRADNKLVIFGGPRGDLPLTEHAGALIGETVATISESAIVDLSELGTKARERRFMLAFLTALYAHANSQPVHLVFDEVDMWAPQRLLDKEGGESAKLLGQMETVVRRGRVRGFIPWLITQRPAVVSKDVLSQVDGLVAFKLTSSQDRDALEGWVEGQADKQQWKDMRAALPTLQRGQGVVWIPARGVFETTSFPTKVTFDSSRTPKRGEKKAKTATLKQLDVAALKEKLASVEAEKKADDPRALRAEIVRLNKIVSDASKAKGAADPDAIAKAEERGFERGKKAVAAESDRRIREARVTDLQGLCDLTQPLVSFLVGEIKRAKADKPKVAAAVTFTAALPSAARSGAAMAPRSARAPAPATVPRSTETSTDGSLQAPGGPEQRILNSLATWRGMGHEAPGNAQVAWLAGYSPSSTSYTNPRGALKTKGLLDYPDRGRVSLTADGASLGVTQEIDGGLLNFVLAQLPTPERRILAAAANRHPDEATNEEVAADAGYSPDSTSYTNPRGALKTKELISYPTRGKLRAADWLFS